MDTKPTVPDVMPLVRMLECGQCLHIVLDDGNVEDGNVDFCIEWAEKEGHEQCAELGRILRKMTKTQRRKVSELV